MTVANPEFAFHIAVDGVVGFNFWLAFATVEMTTTSSKGRVKVTAVVPVEVEAEVQPT